MKKTFLSSAIARYRSFSPKTKTFTKLCAVMIIMACGPQPMDYAEYFSLFYPENASTPPETKPYYYSSLFLNEEPYFYEENPAPKAETIEETENINAWHKYLNAKIDRNSIKSSLYGETKLSALAAKVSGFDKAASSYLLFAAEAENATPHKENYWDDEPTKDSLKIVSLISKANSEFIAAPNDFLKERYLFQILKLKSELHQSAAVIEDYAKLSPKINSKTFISDWSKSRVAGAEMAQGDTAKAVFEFAQIFNNCSSRRYQADMSVRRTESDFFSDALKLAKTNDEKANVLALQGVQPLQDGLSILEEIYDLNPKHPLLELVFAREINKNEMQFFADKNSNVYANNENYYDDNYKIDKSKVEAAQKKGETYLDKLANFSEKLASENKVANPQFWNLSNAYFYYLKNQTEKGLEVLKKVKIDGNPFLKKQVEFLTFEMMEKKPETEANLLSMVDSFTDVKTFRDNNLLVKSCQTLANFYAQKTEVKKSGWLWSCSKEKSEVAGNSIKAFLAQNIAANSPYGLGYELGTNQNDLIDTCSVDFLKKLIAFTNSKELNANDKKLVTLSNLTADHMNLALARREVFEEKFADAAKTFKLVSAKTLTENGFDENFESESKDINLGKTIDTKVSQADFLNKLASLQAKTKSANASAKDWYEYGKALYNLSYYGQAWILTQRGKSMSDLEYKDEIKSDYYQTSSVKKAFLKALSLNPDKELAAKICYGGALCERNQYLVKFYSEKPDDYNQNEAYLAKMSSQELPKYRSFFTNLLKKYNDTQYQKMVLQECETYANFAQ